MEGNKTKLKRILIPIIAVILVISLTAGFFIIKNNASSKSPENDNSATNVVDRDTIIERDIFNSWTDEEYSVDFNGDYKFSAIHSINFNPSLTDEQINMVYKNIGNTSDRNGFMKYILSAKKKATRFEVISIVDGQFTQSDVYNYSSSVKSTGYFFGNTHRSYLYIDNGTGTAITRNDGAGYMYEISQTGFGLSSNVSLENSNETTKLYITEHFYSSKTTKTELYSVTYIYEMIEVPQNKIPNSDIR